MTETIKYDFSYTAFTLRTKELVDGAIQHISGKKIDKDRLGAGKNSTGIRKEREIRKRLSQLTESEINLLLEGSLDTQKQIAFLAMCKLHLFLRDFTIEVLREKLLLYDYELTEGEYISFFRRKAELHPKMDELTETTQNKIQQVTFKILEQAGLIDDVKTKIIQPQILEEKTIKTIISDDPAWLKIFLYSDMDILKITKQ